MASVQPCTGRARHYDLVISDLGNCLSFEVYVDEERQEQDRRFAISYEMDMIR